ERERFHLLLKEKRTWKKLNIFQNPRKFQKISYTTIDHSSNGKKLLRNMSYNLWELFSRFFE
ncbi:MAG: hypothetical protein LBT05_12860, partial [Planctomycetaceae bacterium]|nr:hypothetical protein [Planctomycetaceae bacterium]